MSIRIQIQAEYLGTNLEGNGYHRMEGWISKVDCTKHR